MSGIEPNTYRLFVFGEFLLCDTAGDRISPLGRKARAIVAYLALTGGAATRDDLAALLWSDRGIEQARSSLRQACYELRHKLPTSPSLLIFKRDEILLDRGLLRIGADKTDDDAKALAASFTPARRVLLRDFNDLSPAFDEWLRIERVRLADSRRDVAREVAQGAMDEGRWSDAQCIAGAYLTMEPVDEDIARIAMSASAKLAQIGEVRRFYRLHAKGLRTELDAEPSLGITTLFGELTGCSAVTSPSSGPPIASQPDVQLPDETGRSNDEKPLSGARRALWPTRRYAIAAAGLIAAVGLVATTRRWAPERSSIPLVTIGTFTASADDRLARAVGEGLPAIVAEDLVGTNTPVEIIDNTAPAAKQATLVARGSMRASPLRIATQ